VSEEQIYKVQDEGSAGDVERREEASSRSEARRSVDSGLIVGGLLIIAGILILVGRVFDIRWLRLVRHFVWPLYVIVPGAVVFLLGLVTGAAGEGLVVVGSIVTTVGLLLFYQNTTGHWQSWAYAWALVAPTSVGVGQIIYGVVKGEKSRIGSGIGLVTVGGTIFVVGAIFFELIIGISGFRLGPIWLPVILIGLGVLGLIRTLFFRRRG
jgi:hypothetical protein